MVTECCKNCEFFHELIEFKDHAIISRSVCTVYPQTEKGYDAFALVVSGNGMCEMFTEVKE